MKNIALIFVFLLATSVVALAQPSATSSKVVSSCGSVTYVSGTVASNTQDTTGKECTGASFTGGSITANQGTPNAGGVSNAWYTQGPNGATSFTANQISVSSTATQILAASGGPFVSKVICNQGTVAVYIGGAGVTTSNGGIIIGGTGTSNPPCWDLTHFPGAIYGIVATGSDTVGYVNY